jgi:hypothetical protein
VKGLGLEHCVVGLDLGSSTDPLRLIDVTFAMSQWHVAPEVGASIAARVPRMVPQHARTSGGRHGPTQEHVLGGGLHAHARSSSRAH